MRHLRAARDKKRNELLARPDMIITVPTDTEVIDYFRQDPVIASIMDEYTHLKSIGGLAFHMRGTAEQPDDRHPTPGRNAHSLNPL